MIAIPALKRWAIFNPANFFRLGGRIPENVNQPVGEAACFPIQIKRDANSVPYSSPALDNSPAF
jgi:hypothetical protein